MHTTRHSVISMAPTQQTDHQRRSTTRPRHGTGPRNGLRPVRLFAALGIVVVPVSGVLATSAIDPMAADTQLMLAGGFITLGFGSLVALITTRHAQSVHRSTAY